MTKIAKAKDKTMQELARDYANATWCYDRVSDLEAFGEAIRHRTIGEAWVILVKTYGIDVDFKEFKNLFTDDKIRVN